jgi:hypothetical protein
MKIAKIGMRYEDNLGPKIKQQLFPDNGVTKLFGYLNVYREIHKRTNTIVAFTWEYFKVYKNLGTCVCLSKKGSSYIKGQQDDRCG